MLLTLGVLGGCAAGGSPVVDSVRSLVSTGGTGVGKGAIPDALDLRYWYLRVEVDGHPPGLLVLGYVDPDPAGPIQVWYSGTRETLRTQNGRIVGATGTLHEWKAVRFIPAPPAWAQMGTQGASFVRLHDAMPGYHFGVTENMRLEPWQGLPLVELPASLPLDKARSYQWFRESAQTVAGPGSRALPDAWFAFGVHRGLSTIVYSEQCLEVDFCLKLQPWPLLENDQ